MPPNATIRIRYLFCAFNVRKVRARIRRVIPDVWPIVLGADDYFACALIHQTGRPFMVASSKDVALFGYSAGGDVLDAPMV